MKPRSLPAFLVLGALVAGSWQLATQAVGTAPAERHFSFEYKTVLKVPPGAGKVEVWVPVAETDAFQTVSLVAVEGGLKLERTREASLGNSMLHLAISQPNQPEVVVTLKFDVLRREHLRKDFPATSSGEIPAEVKRWLEPDKLGPVAGRIRELALEVTQGKATPLEKAQAIYDYVVSTMKYDKSGTGWGNGDIYWACDTKRGNCTDFHALFMGLCRAVGIPARFSIGFPLPAERGHGEIGGYHCWAEFYLVGYGWVPVDASEAAKHPDKRAYFFGAHDENRVQFTVGRDLELSPRQAGAPLNYFVYPYVEVDGKPYTELTKSFRFADQAANGG